MKKTFWIGKVLKGIVIATAAVSLFSWIVMMLWNNVLASVTTVGQVSFWQAMGLLVLSKILFGGFRGGWRGGGGGPWRKDMREKWEKMTPEERSQFKNQWKDRCRSWKGGRFDQSFNKEEEKT